MKLNLTLKNQENKNFNGGADASNLRHQSVSSGYSQNQTDINGGGGGLAIKLSDKSIKTGVV